MDRKNWDLFENWSYSQSLPKCNGLHIYFKYAYAYLSIQVDKHKHKH